uniref:Uncharacterized protein n=1 Tax=Anguilla anguilla TaxID=7936 RepID=A0A0E9TJ82_ANGAN
MWRGFLSVLQTESLAYIY